MERTDPLAAHGELVRRRPRSTDDELDITPMIDCVFLLLIYFLVTSVSSDPAAVELPKARHGVAVSVSSAVVITLAERGGTLPARVYLADGAVGAALPDDPQAQESAIVEAIEQGLQQGKQHVLIKAERSVLHRDVARVIAAASQFDAATIDVAVLETGE